jgi:hypothetical protein
VLCVVAALTMALPQPAWSLSRTESARPVGTFRTTISVQDLLKGGIARNLAQPVSGTYTLKLTDANTFTLTQEQGRPLYRVFSGGGRYAVTESTLVLQWKRPESELGVKEKLKFVLTARAITFKTAAVGGKDVQIVYIAHPWRKVT